MCNKIHWNSDTVAIPSFGKGYKLFSGKPEAPTWMMETRTEVPETCKFDIGQMADPQMYKETDESQLGFCFFLTWEEAVRTNTFWRTSGCGWLNILPITYVGGIAEFDEWNMIGEEKIRVALCKEFSRIT